MTKAKLLRNLFEEKKLLKVIGAHDGISARLGEIYGFDAIWASGLGISATHCVPDASILTMTEFLASANIMNKATSIPVIADCDTGFGEINNIIRTVKEYEAAGIAAICIEDKVFPKRNSFLEGHSLADMYEFCAKISIAKKAQTNPHFMIIARLESLIANKGIDDAIIRAKSYCDHGADAILVHSKANTHHEVFQFAEMWKQDGCKKPLIIVPTTYYNVTCTQIQEAGIQMAIYANQPLRAMVQSIREVLQNIVEDESTVGVESNIATVKEIFNLSSMEIHDRIEKSYEQMVKKLKAKEIEQYGGHNKEENLLERV